MQQTEFLDGIINRIDERIQELASRQSLNLVLMMLKILFVNAKNQKDLPFIQDEETNVWVKPFIQFYRQEIVQFCKKHLFFDEEKQVQKKLNDEVLIVDNLALSNFCFKDSAEDAMIQISDYVVSIVRKYIIFLDRTQLEVENDIAAFDEFQISNFILMNKIFKASQDKNSLFFNFNVCIHTTAVLKV